MIAQIASTQKQRPATAACDRDVVVAVRPSLVDAGWRWLLTDNATCRLHDLAVASGAVLPC